MSQEANILAGHPSDADRVRAGDHHDPHSFLGAHPASMHGTDGVVIRVFHPAAEAAFAIFPDGLEVLLHPQGGGVFAGFVARAQLPLPYRVRLVFADGRDWVREDPYRFLPTLGELDLYLFSEGKHRRLWEVLGANRIEVDGVWGTRFAVWAPGARRVSVIGDFSAWDGRHFPMRSVGASGVWELFIPGVEVGTLYKYELKTQGGDVRVKTDPMAQAMELPPAQASCVTENRHQWQDGAWMTARAKQNPQRLPMNVYELHLGSWARIPEEGYRSYSYREIAPKLVAHLKQYGYTHVELLPVAEHAFYGSWGYQVTGYYAATSRYGTPDDLRFFVDYCHQNGIGVIVDWVPAHFPKDDFALRRFDGSALYEHDDPRQGEHPDWGTLIFNFGRNEVRNFLVANALYWLQEYHIDGLRVDAVASMLYLDYSREEGQWIPNQHGGRENIEAIEFIKEFNAVVRQEVPGAMTIAEESTSWFGVSKPVEEGGLGFTFKWNMGWMHDTLKYFAKDPVHRKYHQNDLTFSMIYEYSEVFINSISHDEVTHGKGSLMGKMPGDLWQKFANLRLLLAYQYFRPGKVLNFMGIEVAQYSEWNHDGSVEWSLAQEPERRQFDMFLKELGAFYLKTPELWAQDPDPAGFDWLDCSDYENSILLFLRKNGSEQLVVAMNMTPVPRENYRFGVPEAGTYEIAFCSDDQRYGGSAVGKPSQLATEALESHGRAQSVVFTIPPLSATVLRIKR